MKKNLVVDAVFCLLLFYLLVMQIQAIWPFTIDDMYISLRYAKHWALGEGLVWNLHEPVVEGYSNFLFVWFGAIALYFKLNPVWILKALGVVGLVLTCLFSYAISRFWFPKRQALLSCIAILLYKGQILWSVSGLETTIYQSLVCASVYLIWKGLGYSLFPADKGPLNYKALMLVGFLMSVAGLTRFEAPALMLLFILLMLWDLPKPLQRQSYIALLCLIAPLLLLYCPYYIWRWHYYGLLFPNPLYCKAYAPELLGILDFDYIKLAWPWLLLSAYACLRATDKRVYFLLLPSLLYLLLLLNADPIVAFDNRLFLPAWVLLIPLGLVGLRELLFRLFNEYHGYALFCFYFSCICMFFVFIPSMSLTEYKQFTHNPLQGELLRMTLVRWLNQHVKDEDTIVLGDCGLIPYFLPFKFIDSYCLNNRKMAQFPASTRAERFCQQILLQQPRFIILSALKESNRTHFLASDACLKSLLKHQETYTLIRIFETKNAHSSYRYEVYRRR